VGRHVAQSGCLSQLRRGRQAGTALSESFKHLASDADLIPASLSLDNRVADRIPHQFRGRMAIGPQKDIVPERLYGLPADAEPFRNFPTGV